MRQQLAIFFELRLFSCNSPNKDTKDGFCCDICHWVTHLLIHSGCGPCQSYILHQVNDGISEPRDHSEVASSGHKGGRCGRWLLAGCLTQTGHQDQDEVASFTGVTKDHNKLIFPETTTQQSNLFHTYKGQISSLAAIGRQVAERQHGQSPPEPADLQVILNLTRVAQSNHDSCSHTQLPTKAVSLSRWQLHY